MPPKLFFTFIILFVLFCTCIPKASTEKNNAAQNILQPDSVDYIQISAVGDLMCHSTMYNYAKVNADSFNFNPSFEVIAPYLQQADLLIGNLETTFGGTDIPYSGYPQFNTPDDFLDAIKNAGFDFITTANNHANDTGEKGILRTIQQLDKYNIAHTGTFASQRDRDSIRIIKVKGIKLAVVSYTFSTNGLDIPAEKSFLVNYIDSALIKNDLAAARKKGDLVLVFFHFGTEYERAPNAYQKNYVNWAIAGGADIILGGHPHVVQPAEFYKTQNAKLDTGFVIYSLGNFISNQKDEYTDEGVILNLHIAFNRNSKKIKIENVDYVPTWVYRGTNEKKKIHVVVPATDTAAQNTPEYIDSVSINEMKRAYENTTSILHKYTTNIQVHKY